MAPARRPARTSCRVAAASGRDAGFRHHRRRERRHLPWPIYAGNAIATVTSNESVKVVTVRGTAFEAAAAEGGSAAVKLFRQPTTPAFKLREVRASSSERPELTSAPIVISGGRGMQDGANFAMLEKVADKLGPRLAPRAPPSMPASCRTTTRWPDRQGRRPRSVCRRRHLGRDPASCRHEGQQGHRRHQQG